MMEFLKNCLFVICALHLTTAYRVRTDEEVAFREHMLKHADALTDLFISEYENYTRSGVISLNLQGMFKMMQVPEEFAYTEMSDLDAQPAIMSCMACRTSVGLILRQYRSGSRTKEQVTQDAIAICRQFTPYSQIVCEGAVRKHADLAFFIFDNRPALTANQLCNMVLQPECGDPDPAFDFRINISPGQPITGPKAVFTPRSSNELKILHFTDIHYDPNYLVGGFANCPDPICCRRAGGIAPNPQDRAGRWGDYRKCGSPWEAVENTLRSAHAQHPDADMVYVTGDYIDHGVWETTQEGNVRIFDRIYGMLKTVFGNKPVYVVIGNHEANPTNQFAPVHITAPNLSTNWLYNHAATGWSRWLPTSTQATIRRGGYYTTLSPDSRLRIIALNNNDCYPGNFWIFYSTSQIVEQLQWLHDTLLAAERAGQFVHIVGHMDSGTGSCYRWWSREYRRIIERFHRIIGGQFFGHSHLDEFIIYYARDQPRIPINLSWLGGATTTHSGTSPNYVVYNVDKTHYQVVEKESWYFNVNEANANPSTPPNWRRQYVFSQHFQIPNLSPAALDNFVTNRLSRSRQMLLDYRLFMVSNSPFSMRNGCNEECLRWGLCRITVNEATDHRKCNEINSFPLV